MPSEQERYSLDEIMDRLKHRSPEESDEGKLITREDGSQAIRVRKRKRRTHQPSKERQETGIRLHIIQLSAVIALVFIALLVASIALIYGNSPPFRDKLTARISSATGAQAELTKFRMAPTAANADILHLSWPEGNILETFRLNYLQASTHPYSFIGRMFKGEEITAKEGRLTLRFPSPGKEPKVLTPFKGNSESIDFKRYSIRQLMVQLGSTPASKATATNIEASFQAKHPSGRPQLTISRGNIQLPQFPSLQLSRGHIEFQNDDIEIVQLILQNESNRQGTFALSGRLSPYTQQETTSLAVKLEHFQIEHLLGPQLGQLLTGNMDSVGSAPESNSLSFSRKEDNSLTSSFTATFTNSLDKSFTFKGFPFLASLHQLTDDPWFQTPVFESKAQGKLHKSGEETAIRDIYFVAKGRMQIRGSLSVNVGGIINGDLKIGLSDSLIGSCPNATLLEAMFGPEKDDYRWLTIRLAGTTTSPSDNFRKLIDDTRTRLMSKPVEDGSNPSPGIPGFEELTPSR